MADNIAAFRPSYRPEPPDSLFSPDMRRLALAAAAITGGLTLVVAGYHMLGHAHTGVPVIEAMSGPIKVKPDHPGGMVVAGAGDAGPANQVERLAPPPEQPALSALRAKLHAAEKKIARQQAELEQAQHVSPRIVAAPPVRRAAAIAPLDLAIPQVAQPLPLPSIISPRPEANAVQLAAFESEAAARAYWGDLQKKLPTLFHDRRPELEQADFAGHHIWRLRTGGFVTVSSAATFCARLRDQGTDCKIAAF
jgi:hypothetical protein